MVRNDMQESILHEFSSTGNVSSTESRMVFLAAISLMSITPGPQWVLTKCLLDEWMDLLKQTYFYSEWVKVAQSSPTLCHPMDYTAHEILQARILEWVAFSFSRGCSQPRDRTQVRWILYQLSYKGSPLTFIRRYKFNPVYSGKKTPKE